VGRFWKAALDVEALSAGGETGGDERMGMAEASTMMEAARNGGH
jgi:hypothetical protein